MTALVSDEILTPLNTEGERARGGEEKNNKDEPEEIATTSKNEVSQ